LRHGVLPVLARPDRRVVELGEAQIDHLDRVQALALETELARGRPRQDATPVSW
jgi:hypothetical protein